MHPETLYPKTKQVLENIKNLNSLSGFYLGGGTALSLQLGHRKSIDLDFFTSSNPKKDLILQDFSTLKPKIIQQAEGTLDLIINEVKVSLLEYKYPLIVDLVNFDGVTLAGVEDIACMKISAISSRGSKKDFVDIYKILQTISMDKVFELFDRKFAGVEYQKSHILKALLTFDLAEDEPNPDMIENIEWANVKRSIEKDVNNYLDTLRVS